MHLFGYELITNGFAAGFVAMQKIVPLIVVSF